MTVVLDERKMRRLATILAEEFDRDGWGDFNPYLFNEVANPLMNPEDEQEYTEEMRRVLRRVASRLGEI